MNIVNLRNIANLFKRDIKYKKLLLVSGPPFLGKEIHWGTYYNTELKNFYQIVNIILYNRKMHIYRGFDVHGLPTDLKVLKLLGLSKKDAFKDSAKFIAVTNEYVKDCEKKMSEQINLCQLYEPLKMPYYLTNTKEHYECVWGVYNSLKKRGLIYHTLKCRAYCIFCVAGLSNVELECKVKKLKGWYYRYKLKNYDNSYLLVWTTTYWTIPGTCNVAYNAEDTYALWKTKNEEYYVLSSTLPIKIKELIELEFVKTITNSELASMQYVFDSKTYSLVSAPWVQIVTSESEYITGLVNIVPLHHENDLKYAVKNNIKCTELIDDEGYYVRVLPKNVRINDYNTIKQLLCLDLLFEVDIQREVNTCYRCNNITIDFASYDYFLKITNELKKQIIVASKSVLYNDLGYLKNFENWINNAHDWCISRSRVYGIPIPELKNKTVTNFKDIGVSTVDELYNVWPKLEHSGRVFDCWFESGCVHIHSYDKYKVPSQYFIEGCDQVRGWLYTSSVLFMYIYHQLPYLNVHMHGFLLQDNKTKLSKSKLGDDYSFKNELNDVIAKYGIEALKLYTHSIPDWTHAQFKISEIEIYSKKWAIIKGLLNYFYVPPGSIEYSCKASELLYYHQGKIEDTTVEYMLVSAEIINKLNTCYDLLKENILEMDTKRYTMELLDTLINKISRQDLKILKKCDAGVLPEIKNEIHSQIYDCINILLAPYSGKNVKMYKKGTIVTFKMLFLWIFIWEKPIVAQHDKEFKSKYIFNWIFKPKLRTRLLGRMFLYIRNIARYNLTYFDYKKLYGAYENILKYRRDNKISLCKYLLINPNDRLLFNLNKYELSIVTNATNLLNSTLYNENHVKLYTALGKLSNCLKIEISNIKKQKPISYTDRLNAIICIEDPSMHNIFKDSMIDLMSKFKVLASLKITLVNCIQQGIEVYNGVKYRIFKT